MYREVIEGAYIYELKKIVFFLATGCILSSAAYTIYSTRNSYEKRIVRGIAVVLSSLVVSSFVPNVLVCMSTLTFGVPSRDYWVAPLHSNDASVNFLSLNSSIPAMNGANCEEFSLLS